MKLECDIVLDLLPLYAEGLLRERSQALVGEHLEGCPACRAALEELKAPEVAVEGHVEPLKEFRRRFRRHTFTVAALTAFVTILVVLFLWSLFIDPGDVMGYALLSFYLILPLTCLVCALLLGLREHWIKWLAPVLFAALALLLSLLVFRTTDEIFFFVTFVPGLAGLLIGQLVRFVRRRRK